MRSARTPTGRPGRTDTRSEAGGIESDTGLRFLSLNREAHCGRDWGAGAKRPPLLGAALGRFADEGADAPSRTPATTGGLFPQALAATAANSIFGPRPLARAARPSGRSCAGGSAGPILARYGRPRILRPNRMTEER